MGDVVDLDDRRSSKPAAEHLQRTPDEIREVRGPRGVVFVRAPARDDDPPGTVRWVVRQPEEAPTRGGSDYLGRDRP